MLPVYCSSNRSGARNALPGPYLPSCLSPLGGPVFRVAMGIFADHIGPKKTRTIGQLIVLLALFWGWRLGNDLPQLIWKPAALLLAATPRVTAFDEP